MSDEEIVRDALQYGMSAKVRADSRAALSRILSDRDSLRAALEEIVKLGPQSAMGRLELMYDIARQALTSSEKDREPMVMQQLQQTTSSDATLRGTSSEKVSSSQLSAGGKYVKFDPHDPSTLTSSEKENDGD